MELIGRGYPHAHCEAPIKLARPGTGTRRFQEENARLGSYPLGQCGKRAEYRHEGLDLCHRHAGVAALRKDDGAPVTIDQPEEQRSPA